ncbi:unnamed protein product [Symbiodinium natans]|uniref:Uncharacterized protein n=1 Tax=Symbiodinium natans TaxID=878477 RepID=A0A812UU42_9DINO|nr:unnamed protein product [Symbiodinium natans]
MSLRRCCRCTRAIARAWTSFFRCLKCYGTPAGYARTTMILLEEREGERERERERERAKFHPSSMVLPCGYHPQLCS